MQLNNHLEVNITMRSVSIRRISGIKRSFSAVIFTDEYRAVFEALGCWARNCVIHGNNKPNLKLEQ